MKYWDPVFDSKVFTEGDIVWLEVGPVRGYHEIRAIGRKEVFVRHLPKWEISLRRLKGRWRRYWIRRKRRKHSW